MRCYDLTTPQSRVVGKVLRDQASHIGDTVWLHSDDRKVTFAEADAIVNQYSRGLAEAGVLKHQATTSNRVRPDQALAGVSVLLKD